MTSNQDSSVLYKISSIHFFRLNLKSKHFITAMLMEMYKFCILELEIVTIKTILSGSIKLVIQFINF